jgi:hypothetical protein
MYLAVTASSPCSITAKVKQSFANETTDKMNVGNWNDLT